MAMTHFLPHASLKGHVNSRQTEGGGGDIKKDLKFFAQGVCVISLDVYTWRL